MKSLYQNIAIAFLVLSLPLSVFSQSTQLSTKQKPSTKKTLELSSDFSMGGLGFKEAQDESQLVQFSVRPKATYKISPQFGVKADTQLNLTTGRSQTRFQNPNFNFMNILELVAYYQPTQYLKFRAGAINQDHFDNRLFIADRGFPGAVVESTILSGKNFSITPKAQYAIPSSTSFEADRTEAEELPTLTTIGLDTSWKILSWMELKANASQFEYKNLPAVVADQSTRLGNSTNGLGSSDAFFLYKFKGTSQAYGIGIDYTKSLRQNFDIKIVENTEAPSDRRRSQLVGTSISADFKNFTVTPSYALFFAESDSTPALYSGFEYGRNNREGQNIGLRLFLKDYDLSIRAGFTDARLIEKQPLQADMQIFDIGLEFNDVAL